MDRTRRPKPLTYQVSFDSEKVQEEEAEGGRMTNVLDFAGAKWPIFVRILVLSQKWPIFVRILVLSHVETLFRKGIWLSWLVRPM